MRARRLARAVPVGLALGLVAASAQAAPYRQPVNGDVVVTAYYDHGGESDWTCADWTYGGHHGTDIAIIGRFEAQDQGRDIVAAQAGRVTRAHDGEFDRCTTADCPGGGGFGNHVYLEHADGQVTIYGHMRQGSVRVAEGQEVQCGEVLGQVGSSGFSTGPHCHFEVRIGGNADDPFAGQCGGPQSYWVAQGDYRGLPSSDCAGGEPPPPPPPPPPPMRPDLHLTLGLEVDAPRACDFDECRDALRDGASGGLFDAWVGEAISVRVVVTNQGDGGTQGESAEDSAVTLQYEVPPELGVLGYTIESDWPAKDRTSWSLNDAQDNPANPPADAPPQAGALRLNGLSAGEAKRVTLHLRPGATNLASGAHLPVRAWIAHVKGYYGEKSGWDDAVEVNDGQTFNGGDLKVAGELDVFDPANFLFESPDPAQVEGWRRCAPDAVGALAVDTASHSLSMQAIAPGPCIEGPRIAVPLAGYAGVRLTARQHQSTRRGVLQWTTEDEPDFSPSREVAFETHGGEAFEPLALDVPWARDAVLTRLRLLPIPDPGTGDPSFELGELRLAAEPVGGGGAGGAGGPLGGGSGGGPPPLDPDDGVPRPEPPGLTGDAGFGADGGGSSVVPSDQRRLAYAGGCASVSGPMTTPNVPAAIGWAALLGLLGAARRRRGRPHT